MVSRSSIAKLPVLKRNSFLVSKFYPQQISWHLGTFWRVILSKAENPARQNHRVYASRSGHQHIVAHIVLSVNRCVEVIIHHLKAVVEFLRLFDQCQCKFLVDTPNLLLIGFPRHGIGHDLDVCPMPVAKEVKCRSYISQIGLGNVHHHELVMVIELNRMRSPWSWPTNYLNSDSLTRDKIFARIVFPAFMACE